MKNLILINFLVFIIVLPIILFGEPLEFQVNTSIGGKAENPSIAMDAAGNFVIVWESADGSDSFQDIFARRYDSNGNPLGDEFQVNTIPKTYSGIPQIAMNSSGRFIIAWDYCGDRYNMQGSYIYARIYDKDGNPKGIEFLVNAEQRLWQQSCDVAINDDGNFVVTMDVENKTDPQTIYLGTEVYAQKYDRFGLPIGSKTMINNFYYYLQMMPEITTNETSNYVMTWTSDGQDGSLMGVFARIFDSSLNPLTFEFQVNRYTYWEQYAIEIASDRDGNFLIIWKNSYKKSNLNNYYGSRFDKFGNPIGDEFAVNPASVSNWSDVSMDDSGNFIITWDNCTDDDWNIYAKKYNSSGEPESDEFRINSSLDGNHVFPSIAMKSPYQYVVTWECYNDDKTDYCIKAKLFSSTLPTDSPWSMFRHDVNHTGRSPYKGPDTPELKWTYTTGHYVYSSPAIGAEGTIYVGSVDKHLYAINRDGTLRWSFPTGDKVVSSPAIGADGTIYVGSDVDLYPKFTSYGLYAINPDGSLKWRYDTGYAINSSPVIGADGTIFVGSNGIYAINPDGSLKWKNAKTNASQYDVMDSSPAIGEDGTIYTGSMNAGDEHIYAFNPDGSLKWSYQTESFVFSSPAIGTDGTIYVGSGGNISRIYNLYAMNPDGSLKWTYPTEFVPFSSPAIGTDGTIYIGSYDKRLYAINPDSTLKWTYKTNSRVHSSPAIDANGTIYVGSMDKSLYSINPDGTLKWTYTAGDELWSSPAIGSDGTIYIGSNDHRLYAIGSGNIAPTPTITPTSTIFITPTLTSTSTTIPTQTESPNPSNTLTPTPILTPTLSGTTTKTATLSPTMTQQTPFNTRTQTPILTQTSTVTPTITQTATSTFIDSQTPTLTATPTLTITPIITPNPTPTTKTAIFGLGLNAQYAGEWEDTYVDEANPDTNNGKSEKLYLTNGYKHREYTHVRVNIGSLPDDAQIEEAQLYFYVTGPEDGGSFDVASYGLEGTAGTGWTEAGDTFAMFNKNSIDSNWTDNQGGFMDKSSQAIATNTWHAGVGWKYLEFDSSGIEYLNNRIKDGLCNFFTCILPDSIKSDIYKQEVASSENHAGNLLPYLRIVYSYTEPADSLEITSPQDFYNNTVLLSWTPITNAKTYQFDCMIQEHVYSFNLLPDNWLRIIARDDEEWQQFAGLGTIPYRVTALDTKSHILSGPTEIAYFTCYTKQYSASNTVKAIKLNQDYANDRLRISNPPEFYYNTILLSWTPISGADHYFFEYKLGGNTLNAGTYDNWFRIIVPSIRDWSLFNNYGAIEFRVSATDSGGNIISGPTHWSYFKCL
jgi:outer membrane protein assembly factor BamB